MFWKYFFQSGCLFKKKIIFLKQSSWWVQSLFCEFNSQEGYFSFVTINDLLGLRQFKQQQHSTPWFKWLLLWTTWCPWSLPSMEHHNLQIMIKTQHFTSDYKWPDHKLMNQLWNRNTIEPSMTMPQSFKQLLNGRPVENWCSKWSAVTTLPFYCFGTGKHLMNRNDKKLIANLYMLFFSVC